MRFLLMGTCLVRAAGFPPPTAGLRAGLGDGPDAYPVLSAADDVEAALVRLGNTGSGHDYIEAGRRDDYDDFVVTGRGTTWFRATARMRCRG